MTDEELNSDTLAGGGNPSPKDDSDDLDGINDVSPGASELVEIEISEEGDDKNKPAAKPAKDDGEDAALKSADKEKKSNRLRELNRKLRAAERKNAELEQIVGAQGMQINDVHRQNLQQFEIRAEGAVEQAKKDLRLAKENGDIDAEVAASEKLSEAKAYLVRIREHKAGMGDEPRDDRRQPERRDVRDQASDDRPVTNPVRDKWVASNPWFDESADDFDDELAADARSYATNLEQRMQREGTPELIGTRAYFKKIDDYMRESYPEKFADAGANRTPPMRADRNGVTPPTRSNVLGGQKTGGASNKIVLSRAEYEVAMSLGNTAAGKNSDGTRKTEKELAQMYIRQRDSSGEKSRREFEQEGFKQRGVRV